MPRFFFTELGGNSTEYTVLTHISIRIKPNSIQKILLEQFLLRKISMIPATDILLIITSKMNDHQNSVKSTAELLIYVNNIVRNYLFWHVWSNVVLEKEVIFHLKIWIWERFQAWSLNQGSVSTQVNATRVFFYFHYFLCKFDDYLSPNFHRFVI